MNVTKSWLTTARRFTTTTLSCFGVLGLALALTGCGTKLDMSAISKSISDGLTTQMGLTNPAVTCPTESRAAKTGDTFDCDVKPSEGGHIVVTVTQKDDKGGIEWKMTKLEGFLTVKAVEDSIAKGLKEQANADATVSCGDKKIRVSKAGDTFDCKATTADGTAHTVKVTVKDTEGNVTWSIEQPAGAAPAEGAETPEPEQH